MLETASDRLSERGGPHFGSPDKRPAARLETLRLAGELRDPVHDRDPDRDRRDARGADRGAARRSPALHREHGHIQEVIVQNFRAKPGTKMAGHAEPSLDDLLWTAAVARLVLPADVHVQCPPNLCYDDFPRLLDAGIDDWGGVSPVTIDHVNPEAPWPEIERLRAATRGARPRARAAAAGLSRVPRAALARAARADAGAPLVGRGRAGARGRLVRRAPRRPRRSCPATRSRSTRRRARRGGGRAPLRRPRRRAPPRLRRRRRAAPRGERRRGHLRRHAERQLHERLLLQVRLLRVLEGQARREPARPRVRRAARGDRPPRARGLGARRGRDLPPGRDPPGLRRRLLRRSVVRGDQGASCPTCTCTRSPRSRSGRARRRSACRSTTTSRGCATSASRRSRARRPRSSTTRCARVLCPDKVNTEQWLEVHETAHRAGLRSTATIMFGHVDTPRELGAPPAPRPRAAAARRAGSPSSCRCRSCTWRRRST